MTDRIDISEPLRTILDACGVPYNDTASVELTAYPDTLEVTVFERNADGKFFLDRGRKGLFPRTSTHKFRVST